MRCDRVFPVQRIAADRSERISAADALPGNLVTFLACVSLSKRIRLPENGLHTQMEILDPHIPDNKDDSDFPWRPDTHWKDKAVPEK